MKDLDQGHMAYKFQRLGEELGFSSSKATFLSQYHTVSQASGKSPHAPGRWQKSPHDPGRWQTPYLSQQPVFQLLPHY